MEKEKIPFSEPEIEIIPLEDEDVVCTSGYDDKDNWKPDIF